MPGVYIFAAADNSPLYIGKSVSLKSRLAQHFEATHDPGNKAASFVPKATRLILQVVESDLAALILEANLIKTYQPFYNAATKDDKTVSYIVIGDPPSFPISIQHHSDLRLTDFANPATQIYGPYPTATTAGIILKQVRRIFGYCQNPQTKNGRACFYHHIGQCPGPCADKMTGKEYAAHLRHIKVFLSGRFKNLMVSLKSEIKSAIKKEAFEVAARKRDQLNALDVALSSHKYSQLLVLPSAPDKVLRQIVLRLNHPKLKLPPQRIECYDMATTNQENTVGAMVVFTRGQPDKDEYRRFLVKTDKLGDPHTMKHILTRRLRHVEWSKPDLIILDGGVPQLSVVSQIIPPDIPVIALSKKRETLHFYNQNRQIENLNLPLHSSVLKLFQYIRDEAHRFATTYLRLRRQKAAFD